MTSLQKTVAILSPGEMGTAVARPLLARGIRVVTTTADRGEITIERCRAAGITVMPTLQDVVAASDVVISLVSPSAAQDVATGYCRLAQLAPSGAIYVDLNSIGPDAVERMAGWFIRRRLGFVDGAINGLAKNLTNGATLFLSGPDAAAVAALFGPSMRVRVLGKEVGQASAMKMMLSGLSKGLCAMFVQIALAAERRQILDDLIEATGEIYPGLMAIIDRMLPTYAQHARRRVDEMSAAEETMRLPNNDSSVMGAVLSMHGRLANVNYARDGEVEWTVQSFIHRLAQIRPDDLTEFRTIGELDLTRNFKSPDEETLTNGENHGQ